MHYSFHSTPTCTFKSRNESKSPLIQPSPRPISIPLSLDPLITMPKSLYIKLQPSHKLLNKGASTRLSNQTLDQEPINRNHISQYFLFYHRMDRKDP